MTLPILYSFRRCPYAIRARMAIVVSGLVCELREVSLSNKPIAFLQASPKATVPIMVLPDGTVLDESLDIMNYALGHNDPNTWQVAPSDAGMGLVVVNDTTFKCHLDRYKYPQRYGEDGAAHREAGLEILVNLHCRLEHQKFLTGDKPSLIDIAIFPFVRQFAAVDETWFMAQPLDKLASWLACLSASEEFTHAMTTWPVWSPGDEVTYFAKPLTSV